MELVEQQNQFTIKLKELEDDLLYRLANAEGDILGDEELIISLEVTKATVAEINAKKEVAAATTLQVESCLLYTSPSPRDRQKSRMPSSA